MNRNRWEAGQSLLLTDLYQLTMLHGYWVEGMSGQATFELFVRRLGPRRSFLVAAGLEQALAFLEAARFTEGELEWLRDGGRFPTEFIDHLADWRFTGEVRALPEGSVFFPDEPLLQVTAPIAEAQLVESRLLNILHLHTLFASKAVRCRLAAGTQLLVDFGMRRAHGAEAALAAARSSYLVGFHGSSTVLAGERFDIPLYGTMAHSYVQTHDGEAAAFEGFARARREGVVLLIDTYDTERGAEKVVQLAPRLAEQGIAIAAVRLDSGDLAEHARRVRAILDTGGLTGVRIFASGDLDEYAIARLLGERVPVDGFGIGTRMDTSADAPYLDCAYKLTEYAGRGRRKHSEGKSTWPGRKQVYRRYDGQGRMTGDVLTLADEAEEGEPLLVPVMSAGRRCAPGDSLQEARRRLDRQITQLPGPLKGLGAAPAYPVEVAPALRRMADEVDRDLTNRARR